MSIPSNTDRMVWCDTETFGLEFNTDPIIELGFVITDRDLVTIDDFDILVWESPWYDTLYKSCGDFVKDMHQKSGLWDSAMGHGRTMEEAVFEALHWLNGHGISRADPLCGSSVHFDRNMLRSWMPNVEALFMHRDVDISTIKESCRREAPEIYEQLEKRTERVEGHRVLSDVHDSIGEYAFYREFFFKRSMS